MRELPVEITGLKTGESVKKGLQSYSIDIPHRIREDVCLPYNQNLDNKITGVTERILAIDPCGTKPPQPEPGAVDKLKPVADKLAKIVRSRYVCQVKDLLAYAEERPQRTRNRYRKIVAQMVGCGCTDLDTLHHMKLTIDKISRTGLFIKVEGTMHTGKKINIPRIINPRSSIYNVLLGRYLAHMEKKILLSFDMLYGHSDTMMKGKTVFDKAALVKKYFDEGYIAISLDMARFDQHVNIDLLKLEHRVYKKIYNYCPEIVQLLKAQERTTLQCRALDGDFIIKDRTLRCSGDINTSLGNCILMGLMCYPLFTDGMRIMCDGDDTIIWVKPGTYDVDKWPAHFAQFGMNMTLEGIAHTPEELTFCQHNFIQTENEIRMVRSPHKAMLRDVAGFGENGADISKFRKLLYAVGECGMSQYYGVPILQEIYMMNLRIGQRSHQTVFRELSRSNFGMGKLQSRDAVPIEAQTRYSFWLATGFTPLQQVQAESWCRTFTLTDDVCDADMPSWHGELYNKTVSEAREKERHIYIANNTPPDIESIPWFEGHT